MVRCWRCGACYADRIPAQRWFDQYYRFMSKYTHDQRCGEESPTDVQRFGQIADDLANHCPDRSVRVLDFGCGTGGLLNQLRRRGFRSLWGLEPSPEAARVAHQRHRLRVECRSLREFRRQHGPVDLIIHVGVLEHIRSVKPILRAMRAALAPRGRMYVVVPDVTGIPLDGGAPFQEFSVEHINFFGPKSLRNLLHSVGFDCARLERSVGPHTADSSMAVLIGSFGKVMRSSRPLARGEDRLTGRHLARYVKASARREHHVTLRLRHLRQQWPRILVWGVGTHTQHLLENQEFRRLEVAAFVDSNRRYQKQSLNGLPIISPEQVRRHSEPILVSSQVFQSEIVQQIRNTLKLPNRVLTLY